ncbi:ribosomal RNA small subunit methyltransferase A [Candidatus Micrarchaeota archaeon]|nr:ribosomal RNA small subunit methyltransferase A [Candidatus Micrarchaeota archaeon]
MRRRQYLGQHFLKNPGIARYEVNLLSPEGIVLEIGGGDGRITKLLAKKAKKVIVVEKDKKLADILRSLPLENIEVKEGDFLKMDFKGYEFDCIFGNIPYSISSPILFRIAEIPFKRAVLMVQKEFAERLVAKPGEKNYGRLSITSSLYFKIELKKKVKKENFSPSPRVDSAVIFITKKSYSKDERLEELINILFQHRNQLVSKVLKRKGLNYFGELESKRVRTLTLEEIKEILRA